MQAQKLSGEERIRFNEVADQISTLFQEFSSHQSFDTYFKKLFHLGEDKINLKKRLLNLYFLWEHSSTSIKFNLTQDDPDYHTAFIKKSLFDKRYDALIAGLLKPISGKPEVLCKVNFITWNYDLNLLISIKNFFYPTITYQEFLRKIEQNKFQWIIDDKITITNVNGYFYTSNFNGISDLSNINVDNMISEKISYGYYSNINPDEDANKIRFAWELNQKDEKELKERLMSIVEASENLVIIGYTFPVYNRFIDFGYLQQADLIKKNIVIQDPNSDSLEQNLLDIYRINKKKTKIQLVTNCNSFYLPSSIFGIDEYKEPFKVSVF